MALVNGPDHHPHDGEPPRRHKAPEALRHLRRTLTHPMALKVFTNVFQRSPQSDDELAEFVGEYTLEMYDAGYDEWPELRRSRPAGGAT